MDVRVDEPMDISSEGAQHSGGDSGPISALPASTPANASDAPSPVSQHVSPTLDVHKQEQLKEAPKDSSVDLVDTNHGAAEEAGAKEVSGYTSELQESQSRSNRSTVEPFGVGITQNVPDDDPVGEEEEEQEQEESFVGSLDVCLVKYLLVWWENINKHRWTRTRQTLLWEI